MEDDKSLINDDKKTELVSKVEWSIENELLLVGWADSAMCYKWLHTEECRKYRSMHMWFTIPVITLSTITGTASFAIASVPEPLNFYAPMIIGSINILVGILGTIQQYMKISELKESHNFTAISWDKMARNIRTELTKLPRERVDCGHFLKTCRADFDRFMETSPPLSKDVVAAFECNFQGVVGSDKRRLYDELMKPDVCNIMVSTNQNRHHWYKVEQTIIKDIENHID